MEVDRLQQELAEAQRRFAKAMKKLPKRGADQAAFSAALDEQLAAERRLAAARGEEYAVPFELGVRWSGGAPLPHLLSSGHRSFVAFYLDVPDPSWDGSYTRIVDPADDKVEALAIAELQGVVAVKMGRRTTRCCTATRDETVEAVPQDIEVRTVRMSMRELLRESIEKLWPA